MLHNKWGNGGDTRIIRFLADPASLRFSIHPSQPSDIKPVFETELIIMNMWLHSNWDNNFKSFHSWFHLGNCAPPRPAPPQVNDGARIALEEKLQKLQQDYEEVKQELHDAYDTIDELEFELESVSPDSTWRWSPPLIALSSFCTSPEHRSIFLKQRWTVCRSEWPNSIWNWVNNKRIPLGMSN